MNRLHLNSGRDLSIDSSIFEKIEFLLNKGLCFVKEENRDRFLNELGLLKELCPSEENLSYNNTTERIAKLTYLEFNQSVITEVSNTVCHLLVNNPNERTFYGILLRKKFESKLLLTYDVKSRKKHIEKNLSKALKTIRNTVGFDLSFHFSINDQLTVSYLPLLIESFYNSYFTPFEDIDYIEGKNIAIKKDALTHIFPCGEPQLNMYLVGEYFLLIMDMLNFIEELKQEMKKMDHDLVMRKDAFGSNYNVQNVNNENNRFPLVFKNSYSCELFLYIFSFHRIKDEYLFWYYYDIFYSNKHFKKHIKPKHFLGFIEVIYGVKKGRIKKDISSKKLSQHINAYINFKKLFNEEITRKT